MPSNEYDELWYAVFLEREGENHHAGAYHIETSRDDDGHRVQNHHIKIAGHEVSHEATCRLILKRKAGRVVPVSLAYAEGNDTAGLKFVDSRLETRGMASDRDGAAISDDAMPTYGIAVLAQTIYNNAEASLRFDAMIDSTGELCGAGARLVAKGQTSDTPFATKTPLWEVLWLSSEGTRRQGYYFTDEGILAQADWGSSKALLVSAREQANPLPSENTKQDTGDHGCKNLFSPLDINGMTLPNRIVVPAMVTRLSGEDGLVNANITDRYVRFAQGGAGLIVIEAMAVHQSKSGPLLRISDDEFVPGLRDLRSKMANAGPGRVVSQIIHFLKISRSGWRQKVEDLTIEDINGIVSNYAAASLRAADAGFDGVELHMAHAYTLSSFLSRLNKRRDHYGGSLNRRLALPVRVVEAVREAVGDNFPIGVRFDGDECIKGGYTVDESKLIALRLSQAGVDYISVSAGGKFEDAQPREGEPLYPYTGYSGDRCMPGKQYPNAANLYIASGIKDFLRKHGDKTPVVATGKVNTPDLAESILTDGHADLIGMARPILCDPDWPRKVESGNWKKVVRCCYANVCKAKDERFQTVSCFLWPKGEIQAPSSEDNTAPEWPDSDAKLTAKSSNGRISLSWQPATDNEAIYGYDVWRSVGDGAFERLDAVPAPVTAYHDSTTVKGLSYRYRVAGYDMGGNRTPDSDVVTIEVD